MSDQFDPYHVWLGIPREEQPPNHYRLLGLRLYEADADAIGNALDQRRAYLRTLQTGKRSALSQKLLNEVSAAGVILLEEARKQEYDRQLRAKEAAAKPPARKLPLPTARPLESAVAASVIPLSASGSLPPSQAYAPPPLSTLPPQTGAPQTGAPQTGEPAPVPAFVAPVTTHFATSSPVAKYKRRRSAGGLLVGVVLAGCLLALLATAVGVFWVIRDSGNEIAVNPRPPVANVDPAVDPSAPKHVEVTPPVEPTVGPNNDPRQVWVYADNARGGFRRIDDNRWVEMTPDAVLGYTVTSLDKDAVVLGEPGSRRSVRLLADRLERRDPELTGTTVFLGKWRTLAGLPSFARRSPSSVTTRPSPDLQSHKYGLVFDGSSRLEIPVPPELDRPGQPFTVEMWVRFAYAETPATLLRCGKLKLTYTPNIVGSPEPAGLRLAVGDQTTGTDSSLAAGRFHHLAITSDGQRGQLVVNGNVLSGQQLSGIRERGRGPVHVGLDPQSQVGLRGIVRGVRVSSVNRYPQRLPASELPKILVADDHSLVALDFQVERGDELRDLAGAPENGRKIGAVWVPLDYFGEYAAEKNWGTVDLMRTFLADHHTLEGETHQTQSELVLKAESGRNVVLVPHLPPENYRFEAAAQRTQGEGGLMIGLVLGGHPAVLCIDGKLGSTRVTGLMTAQGQVLPSTRPLSCPSFDAAGAPRKLHCEVFTKGELASVRLLVDGQAAYEWTGPAAAAAAGSQWQIPCQTLFVGSSEAAFSLREMTLQRLSSSPANLVAAADGPPNPRTGPNTAPLPGTGSFTRERLPVPSQETLDAELAKAWAIYDADWKKATKPLQKATLAKGVLKSGAETTGDPTARYVLIEVARQMFVAAGEVNAALGAARQLEGDFSIPVHQAVAATLVELEKSSLPPEERGQFAKAAIDLADAMLAAADFERADEISAMAVQSVARLKDADLKKDVALRRAEVVGVVKQWNLIEASREALAQTPADPAANLAVGKFYCLVMEDWAKGLAHLASSGDSPFAAAAQLDGKSSKGDAAAGYAAAQAWAKLADDPKAGDREQRLALQRRAKLLLEASLVNLDGLDKVNAQKLMDKLQDVAAKAERGTDPRATADRPGLVGRVMARSKDAGVLITYEPDYLLTRDDLEKVRMAAGVQAGEPWQIMFHGMLTLPTDSRVEVWHAGGSAAGGVHTIFVGEKKVENEVGGNRSNNRITYIPVLRGQHAVLWVLSGVDMGTAGMRLTPTDASGQSLDHRTALIATRDLINKARRIPTKAELQFP